VAVPAEVGAAFEMIEAEAVFEFSVVVFDAPADLGQPNQSATGCGPLGWTASSRCYRGSPPEDLRWQAPGCRVPGRVAPAVSAWLPAKTIFSGVDLTNTAAARARGSRTSWALAGIPRTVNAQS
jgi:hypothetical protein